MSDPDWGISEYDMPNVLDNCTKFKRRGISILDELYLNAQPLKFP